MEELGDQWGNAMCLGVLALAALGREAPDGMALLDESVARLEELGDGEGIAVFLGLATGMAQVRGDFARAAALNGIGMARYRDLSDPLGVAGCLEVAGALALAQDQPNRAARLMGAAQALRGTLGPCMLRDPARGQDECLAALHMRLGEDAFMAAWTEGQLLSLEQATMYALAGDWWEPSRTTDG